MCAERVVSECEGLCVSAIDNLTPTILQTHCSVLDVQLLLLLLTVGGLIQKSVTVKASRYQWNFRTPKDSKLVFPYETAKARKKVLFPQIVLFW